jgi:hypothetical protein
MADNKILTEDDFPKKGGKLKGAMMIGAGALGVKAAGMLDDWRKDVGVQEYKESLTNRAKSNQEMNDQILNKAREMASSTKNFEDLPAWAKLGVGAGGAAAAGLAAYFLSKRFKYVAPDKKNMPEIHNKPGQIVSATTSHNRPTQGPIGNKSGQVVKYTGK